MAKECEPQNANGENDITITLTNTGEVDLVCDVSDPLANYVETGVQLPAGGTPVVLTTSVSSLTAEELNTVTATCTEQLTGTQLAPQSAEDLCEVEQVCDIRIDRQVSCDGGQTYVDLGFDDEPTAEMCETIDSGPVKLRWVAVNNSQIGQQTATVNCELTDGNGNFQTFVMNASDPLDMTPVVIAETDVNECSTVFIDAEATTGVTATLVCECVDATGAIYDTDTDTDTAGFECRTPDFTVEKLCEAQDANGENANQITLTNTGEVDLVCDVEDPLAGFTAFGIDLPVGTTEVLATSASGLTEDTLNTVTATCTEQLTGTSVARSAEDLCEADSICLPKLTFEELQAGDIVTEQYAGLGIHITTDDPVAHPAMIFDSFNPTGGDPDLGTPNRDFGGPGIGVGGEFGQPGQNSIPLGKVLIISEDGDQTDPDDNAGGGTIIFTFDVAVELHSVGILDIDGAESMGVVTAYNGAGDVVASGTMQPLGDNSHQDVPVEASGVRRIEVWFPSSGSVTDIFFCPEFCVEEAINDPRVQPVEAGHAFYLPGISTEFIFEPAGGFIEFDDGTASLTGTLRNVFDPSQALLVDVALSGRTDVPPPGSPKLEMIPEAYVPLGPIDPSTWVYYTDYTGTLTGIDAFAGAEIILVPTGPAFQLGKGANQKNTNFGASSWFTWTVVSQPTVGDPLQATGQGDINIEIRCECVEPECVPMLSLDEFNERSYHNNDGPNPWLGPWMEADDGNAGGVESDPTSGYVQVKDQGTAMSWLDSQALKLYGQTHSSIPGGPSAKRSVDLRGKVSANLMFDWEAGWYVDDTDEVVVEISSDGENFEVLDSFSWITGTAHGSESYDISPWISATTTVRFRVKAYYGGNDEFFWADNIKITSECVEQVCDVQLDRQVSCDGGATWVDAGANGTAAFDDGVLGFCSTVDSGPVKVRWLAVNHSTYDGLPANVSCTLVDGNPNFGGFVAGAAMPPFGAPGVIAMTDVNQCAVYEDGEPGGIEAVLSCECLDDGGQVYGGDSDADAAGFECLTPGVTVDKVCESQGANGDNDVTITVTNTGETDLVCDVVDTLAGFSVDNLLVPFGSNEVILASVSGLTQDTLNTVTADCVGVVGSATQPLPPQSGDDLCEVAVCALDVQKTCLVVPPPATSFSCSDAKPINVVAMIWDGVGTVDLKAWKGSVGSTSLGSIAGITPGQEVTVVGYAGSPNDVFWEIFESGTNFTAKLGESKFHLSCSDSEMNGPEDCGKRQGDGKSDDSGFINDWLFEGLEGEGQVLDCTPTPDPPAESCEAILPPFPSCETLPKPSSLTFRYTGGACPGDNIQGSKSSCTGTVDGAQAASITSDNGGVTILPSLVDPGEEFTVSNLSGSNLQLTLTNGGGSQDNDVHISCSAPLAVGDEFGALTVVAFDSLRGGVEVLYDYSVTNLGSPLTNVMIADDKIDLGVAPFDLATGETRLFSATTEITETTENRVDVVGDLPSGSPNVCAAYDTALVTVVEPPEPCFDCAGGVTELAFRNLGPETYVEIEDNNALLFSGLMPTGAETPTLEGTKSDGKFDGDVRIYADGSLVASIHTSCSQPIGVGMEFGGFEVTSGRSKDGGPFCEADCQPTQVAFEVKDDELKMRIANSGETPLQISRIVVEWPAGKGNLEKIEFDGTIWQGAVPPTSFMIDSGWSGSPTQRALDPGDDHDLKLRFRDKETNGYHFLRVEFTNGCLLEADSDTPVGASWDCSKPIDALTMIWDGAGIVDVEAWKGAVGSTSLGTISNVGPGTEVTFTGFAGSPNDVIWQIFQNGVSVGESKFHLSCSDSEMDGPEDCGSRQGNGKSNDSGLINDWLFEGIVDSDEVFDCTP